MAQHPRRIHRQARPAGPWKHGPIPVVGLIGGIGAGKSQVAAALATLDAFVLDADAVGHALLNQSPVRERVVERFGEGVIDRSTATEGEAPIDRRALGAIVFADPEALRALESIVHPLMRRTFEKAIARTVRQGRARAVVLDAAILLEAGWDDLCDLVVYVDAPEELRLTRLAQERGWTEAVLRSREQAQWPSDQKRRRADAVVTNDAGPDQLVERVSHLWNDLRKPAARGQPFSHPAVSTRRR